jgi:hypothetical protein
MKNEHLWLIWVPLIVLVIILFPKSCGFKNPSQSVNYHCSGFKTPYLSQFDKSDNPQEWCSGICLSSSIGNNKTQNNKTVPDEQTPFSGISDSFGKIVPIMFLILLVVGLIRWIGNISEKLSKK